MIPREPAAEAFGLRIFVGGPLSRRCIMVRTWIYPFAGAGAGFLTGLVLVRIMAGGQPPSDTVAVSLFVGVFLAGAGAVAGALAGGAADLLEFLKGKDESARNAKSQSDSESRL